MLLTSNPHDATMANRRCARRSRPEHRLDGSSPSTNAPSPCSRDVVRGRQSTAKPAATSSTLAAVIGRKYFSLNAPYASGPSSAAAKSATLPGPMPAIQSRPSALNGARPASVAAARHRRQHRRASQGAWPTAGPANDDELLNPTASTIVSMSGMSSRCAGPEQAKVEARSRRNRAETRSPSEGRASYPGRRAADSLPRQTDCRESRATGSHRGCRPSAPRSPGSSRGHGTSIAAHAIPHSSGVGIGCHTRRSRPRHDRQSHQRRAVSTRVRAPGTVEGRSLRQN